MMKRLVFFFLFLMCLNVLAVVQYNVKGNQGWLTFDGDTAVSVQLTTTGKDKDHQNFIDRGEGVADYGWYNLQTGAYGSLNNTTVVFSQGDRIGLYVTDNKGKTYLSTKPTSPFEDDIWGKSKLVDDVLTVGGGNMGSNGTHEYYAFRVISRNVGNDNVPTGQPLPGVIGTMLVGGCGLWYLKNRKKLLAK